MFSRINNDQVSSAFWFVCGAVICIASLRYSLGRLASPEAGFVPFLAGLVICLSSFIGFLQASLKQKQGKEWNPIMRGVMWTKTLIVLVALFAYVLLLVPLGFSLCTALFTGFLLRAVQPQSWRVVISGAFVTAFAAYGIFEVLLKAQLPRGPWGF